MSNSLHLKRYVETHPDNKMAWYLLGKDYERNGEQGKANYCFNRAEEVYEAFELSKVPADIWKNYEMRLLQVEKEREKRAKRIRRALLAAVILLLCLVPSVGAPGDPGERLAAEAFDELLPEAKPAGTDDEPDKNGNEEYDGPLFTAAAIRGGKEGNGLSGLLDKPSRLPSHSVVLGMERAGRWKIWSRSMPAMYGITRDPSGVIGIRPYQGAKELCGCEPADDAALTKTAAGWAEIQVHGAVLSEAVRRFHEDRGRMPKSLNELAQPFPNNWLSGRSPEMKALFPHFVSGRNARDSGKKQGKGGEAAGVPRLPGGLGSSPDGKPFFTDPLVVVIDRKNHRLGVTSGDVLLRNYKVGLGKDNKTPLGDFHISDKVVNPNGTATGTYGSRGMQLSDTDYAIHGTQDVDSIGGNESEGCIRMFKEDVEELFDLVPMGTKVSIEEGVLPDDLVIPKERFSLKTAAGQTNPDKVYDWLD